MIALEKKKSRMPKVVRIEAALRKKLGTDATVVLTGRGKGHLQVRFYSEEDLGRLLDRQGAVGIRKVLHVLGYKTLPGNAAHDLQHLWVGNVAAAELLFDHPPPGFHKTRFLVRKSL